MQTDNQGLDISLLERCLPHAGQAETGHSWVRAVPSANGSVTRSNGQFGDCKDVPGSCSSEGTPSKLGVHEFLPSPAEQSCFPGTRSSTQTKIWEEEGCSLLVVFLPDLWFRSLLSHQLFRSTSNKQSSLRKLCINDFFPPLEKQTTSLKMHPLLAEER